MPRKKTTDPVKIRPKFKNGKLYGYEARYTVNGKRETIFEKTEDAVRERLVKLAALDKAQTASILLSEYIEQWVEREKVKAQTGDIAFQTYKAYEGALRRYVTPGLGHLELRVFNGPEGRKLVDKYFTDLELAHNGARKIQQAAQVLRIVFNDALSEGSLLTSPMANLGNRNSVIPQHKPEEKTILTGDDALRLIVAAQGKSPELYTLLVTALTTGMRQGELLGLDISDIDFTAGTIRVKQQAGRHIDISGRSGTRIKDTKTRKSRTVTLPLDVKNALRHFCEGKSGLVWPTGVGTPQNGSTFMARQFRPLLADLQAESEGFPDIDFHSLRHTHASMLISAGVNIKTVSERLGHASIQITLDTYGHLLPDDDKRAADTLFGFAQASRHFLRAVG